MHKITCLLLSIFMMLLPVSISEAHADTVSPIDVSNVKSALLIEAISAKPLFEYNSSEKMPVAGLARLPALLVICEAFDSGAIASDTVVSVNGKAASIKGATAFLSEGEQINADELLRAAIMINAGDAIHALASKAYGSENAAADKINARLAELGVSAQYSDIIGSDIMLSALDLANIGRALLQCNSFTENSSLYYESLEHTTGAKATELANPNKLIKQYSGCLGIATGSSQDAGYCGLFAAERGNTKYLAVSLGAANSSDRFVSGIEMLDYGFANYRSTKVISAGDTVDTIEISGSISTELIIISETDLSLLLSTGDPKYIPESEYEPIISAPVNEGQVIGKIKYMNSAGELLGEVNLIAGCTIEKAGFMDYFGLILKQWID